jgi:hypothetical protein
MAKTTQDLRQLDRELFELAKWWGGAALSCKIVGVLLGLALILLGLQSKVVVPIIAIALVLGSEFCTWQSGRFAGIAAPLLAKLDWSDAFDWKISGKEIADLLLKAPARFRQNFSSEITEQYFASQEPAGPRRAVENVLESAWWSKHLAHKVGFRYQVMTWVMVIFSFAVLVISIQTVQNFGQLASIGRAITTFVMWIFSFGMLKLAYSYSGFSSKTARIEERAEDLLKAEPTKEEAIILMYDYQMIRMTAPLIPTWAYNSMKDELTRLWTQFRQQKPGIITSS